MKSRFLMTTVAALMMATGALAAQGTARVTVLATGGTIAGAQAPEGGYGYKSGSFDIKDLISAVPNLDKLAMISGEQVVNIGSQDMNDEVWLKLAKRLGEVVKSPGTDAVIITHGTDTVEETGYFLDLVTRTEKPIVMVGSMRPATATSADGPSNLYNGVAVAISPGAKGRGVVTVLNDQIDYARNVVKTNTTDVATFRSVNRGPAGVSNTGVVTWFAPLEKKHGLNSEFNVDGLTKLPRVDIIYAHAGMSPDLIDAAVKLGAKGLVIAGVGDGNMTEAALDRVTAAAKAGVVVVRSTRLASGIVYRNNEVDDDKLGLVASAELNPAKSRVLLMLALTKTSNVGKIQAMFNEY
ncbi:type II asparaginase [Sandarakinorhabdus sp.]|uniref:type II asparaginase n=1 Tax=Sandarakinorhabdus sp. TaxID=1916663 RepID=UPI00286DC055|nr:type II asparaginase [Sandarakinorhabdus sp.]